MAERPRWTFHACWFEPPWWRKPGPYDCRVHCPAHTYIAVAGFWLRINPPFSRRYLRSRPDGTLYLGSGWTWHLFQRV